MAVRFVRRRLWARDVTKRRRARDRGCAMGWGLKERVSIRLEMWYSRDCRSVGEDMMKDEELTVSVSKRTRYDSYNLFLFRTFKNFLFTG